MCRKAGNGTKRNGDYWKEIVELPKVKLNGFKLLLLSVAELGDDFWSQSLLTKLCDSLWISSFSRSSSSLMTSFESPSSFSLGPSLGVVASVSFVCCGDRILVGGGGTDLLNSTLVAKPKTTTDYSRVGG